MSELLTESQQNTYEYIRSFIRSKGIAPTTAEITLGLGLNLVVQFIAISKQSVTQVLLNFFLIVNVIFVSSIITMKTSYL